MELSHTTASLGQLALASASLAYWPFSAGAATDAGAVSATPRHSAMNTRLVLLAVFCSAIADCDKASSPTNTAHTAKVGFITHISGKTSPTPTASRRQRRREGNCRVGSRNVVRSP